ncbi:MAG: nucleotidyltransferase [Cyanobacteria bacterium NC_groundwater_1444_Ag_S-0.65um_54_12]|nr:nucleotidyltransferase [Cyanobacteria bacterium NC_groundwater_1444_Ag_S-0.65um_54_12]
MNDQRLEEMLMLGPGLRDGDGHLLAIGQEASRILHDANIPHLVGGGVAVWAYGRYRHTKDIDLFLPVGKQILALDALARQGFHTRETDARWLYKGVKEEVSIDLIIFTTGDIRLDADTLAHGRSCEVRDFRFNLMGPEDVLLRKIHSANEARFHDWYDGLSILKRVFAAEVEFDWHYFVRLAGNYGIERTLAFIFFALSDQGPQAVPDWVLQQLLATSESVPDVSRH